jgi:hypothetical protein
MWTSGRDGVRDSECPGNLAFTGSITVDVFIQNRSAMKSVPEENRRKPMPGGLEQLGKALIVFGPIMMAVGVFLTLSGKLSWAGRLPGDIVVERKDFTFYFPLATSIILSIVLTLLFWLFGKK